MLIHVPCVDITYVAPKSQQQETAMLPTLPISCAIARAQETPPTTPLYKIKFNIELICNSISIAVVFGIYMQFSYNVGWKIVIMLGCTSHY